MENINKFTLDAMQPNLNAIGKVNQMHNLFSLPKYEKTCNMKRFTYELKKLCKQYNMNQVNYSIYTIGGHKIPIITSFNFNDGSSIGIVSLLNECGFDIE